MVLLIVSREFVVTQTHRTGRIVMKRPYLIQRCSLTPEKLAYDYMGMTEFEIGEQAKSLKRIFAQGIKTGKLTIEVEGESVQVFLVAGNNFSFEEYQEHLQVLATEEHHRPEATYLMQAIRAQLGLEADEWDYHDDSINCWFDFENDVLWVLSSELINQLTAVLTGIEEHWSKK